MKSGRLIIDEPRSGAMNMAVDQALLTTADESGLVTLRIYTWTPPTLSLGYFQAYDDRRTHDASIHCECVRRASGGGAILHHHEMTYSLCLPSANRWSKRNSELYDNVHQVIIDLLAKDGIKSQLYGENPSSNAAEFDRNSFLCFQRRTSGDIVLGGHKICGSAQRRAKNALLQHGSLLYQQSEFAPELPGIAELEKPIEVDSFVENFALRLGESIGIPFLKAKLSGIELESAHKYQTDRFATENWIVKRRK